VRSQLELFGALLADAADKKDSLTHRVVTPDGRQYEGTWDDIVSGMRDASTEFAGRSVTDFMAAESRRHFRSTGVRISAHSAEAFVRGSADAGLLEIVR
jgi:hypothetical protein